MTDRVCREVICWARAQQTPVLCDPKGRHYGEYSGATLLTPNRKEASEVTGIVICDDESLLAAGTRLRESLSLEHCLITLSEDGMALFSEDGVHRYTSRAREVFDVTGAGDTAVAALAVSLAAGKPMPEACRLANIAAGIKVGKLCAATVSLSELSAGLPEARSRSFCTDKIVTREDSAPHRCREALLR